MLAESVPSWVLTTQPVFVVKSVTQLSLGSVVLASAYPAQITRSTSPSPGPTDDCADGCAPLGAVLAELQAATIMPVATTSARILRFLMGCPLPLHPPSVPGCCPGSIRAGASRRAGPVGPARPGPPSMTS